MCPARACNCAESVYVVLRESEHRIEQKENCGQRDQYVGQPEKDALVPDIHDCFLPGKQN